MTHAKHTTIVDVKSDDRFLYVATVIGPDPDVYPHQHKMPKTILTIRAAEYDLDVEDPLVLDMVLRDHHYHEIGDYHVNGIHPLFYMPSVEEAKSFMSDKIEEVRVDRIAPEFETGNRLLAGAIQNKVATKALVSVRDQLLQAFDRRLAEPIQYYRDKGRAQLAQPAKRVDPVEQLLQVYKRDRDNALRKASNGRS